MKPSGPSDDIRAGSSQISRPLSPRHSPLLSASRTRYFVIRVIPPPSSIAPLSRGWSPSRSLLRGVRFDAPGATTLRGRVSILRRAPSYPALWIFIGWLGTIHRVIHAGYRGYWMDLYVGNLRVVSFFYFDIVFC